MNRRLTLTGKNSNEVYYISYPKNLMIFLKYDFTIFMERSIDLCRLYMKTGEYHPEEVAEIRSSVSGCHKYVEQNIHGIFEKLVIDCWIEYICRQNEIGVVTLWNNFIPCRNDFEKTVFSRLCEYRHNYAINQWVNLLKIQEYAVCKVDFVFGSEAKTPHEAAARINYFDLMFNVTANEMGFDLSGIAENKVYNMGRTPNSPIIMRNVSREIIRNVLSDVKYLEDNRFKGKKGEFASDQTAMDAFSAIKAYIPDESDSIVGTMIKSMSEIPKKVYVPAGLKAVIDLEIDALTESDAVLQRCKRCREYFTRDENYDYDYCDRISREGKSCLDIMNENAQKEKNASKAADSALINIRCDRLYKEMSSRVNADITQRDFTDWYKYLMLIRENVINGTATMEDFESFSEYSLAMSFSPQKNTIQETQTPQYQQPKYVQSEKYSQPHRAQKNVQPEKKEVKPFVFERIDRNALDESEPVSYQPLKKEYQSAAVPNSVSSKVIRGVSPAASHAETDFSSVTIPYGNEPEKQNTPKDVLNAVHNAMHQDAIKSTNENSDEDDVKIYDIDIVKVFEPGGNKKAAEKPRFKPLSLRREKTVSAPEKEALPDSPPAMRIEEAPLRREPEKNTPVIPAAKTDIKKQHAVSAYRSTGITEREKEKETQNAFPRDSSKTGQERDRGGNLWETSETRRLSAPEFMKEPEYTIPNPVFNKAIEQTQELDSNFDNILRNMDRKDGFEQIPTDSDGVPVSHKTKRVMDAIFKPSRNNMFRNLNKGNDEQDS